ncbi:hypothetical protein I4U23_013421 [Adineta vaga]|nr:hypothetical protein I4U23_013421 [Adineta vaga]
MTTYTKNYIFYFSMTKPFDYSSIPYCIKDLRHYFEPRITINELNRLKNYFDYQKDFRLKLINYQRQLLSTYNRQCIRYKNQLYIDKNTFENYGFSVLRSNPNILIINEKRFNRSINFYNVQQKCLRNIQKYQTYVQTEPQETIPSNDNIQSQNKTMTPIIIKLMTCSTLIATGYGNAKRESLLHDIDTDQLKYKTTDEDISLSTKMYKKVSNRILLRRRAKVQSSNTYLFTTSDEIIPNEF